MNLSCKLVPIQNREYGLFSSCYLIVPVVVFLHRAMLLSCFGSLTWWNSWVIQGNALVCIFTIWTLRFLFCYFLQSAFISKDKAAEFRHQVYLPITLTKVVEYILIGLGSLCILVALGLLLITCRKKKGRIEMLLINELDTVHLLNL